MALISRRTVLASLSLLAASGARAQAADWPARQPIKLVIPGPPGGAMDNLARALQLPLQQALGQSLVFDFKPGANSIIGIDAVAKAPADGYTILVAPSSAIAINPVIVPKLPYDAQKDLMPVAQMGAGGTLLMASPGSGFKNLQDMVAYARANPGKLSFGSWGNGSTGHLVMEGIKAHYKLDMPHVPYKTTAQEITGLLAGTIQVAFLDVVSPLPHIASGKLTALGISGSHRGPALPNVPTLTEQGFKFDADGWFGVFAPAGTPAAIVNRLNQEIGKAMAMEEGRQKFTQANMALPAFKNPAQFGATVKADMALWQGLAKQAQLKLD